MSAPATKTEITEHPSKYGVTVATSGKELEADVQRKMKLWGVVEAFRDGRMPDNRQIDAALEYAIEHSPVDVNRLSPEGHVLIDDTRDILETLRMIVREKNADEIFQNAVWASYSGDIARAKQGKVVPVSKEDAKKDANEAAKHLRVLLTLFVTNSECRKLLNDLGLVGRDIFATAASKAAERVRPDDEQLNQIDQEAPSNRWVGADGQKLGTSETPELQMKGPQGEEIRYHPKDDPRHARLTDSEGSTRSAGEAYDQAQQAKQEAQQTKEDAKSEAFNKAEQAASNKDQIKDAAKSHAADLNASRDPSASFSQQKEQVKGATYDKADRAADQTDGPNNTEEARNRANEAADQARSKANQLKEKIPEKHRAMASDAVRTSKDIINDKFSDERRDQFIYRLKKIVVECQEHKDYREAMTWLLDSFETYKSHAKHVTGKGADAAQDVKSDPAITDSTLKFRVLLERFANGKSMDGIFSALDQIYADADNDRELREWFNKLDDYVHRCLLEPGFILEDESDQEGRDLIDSGKYFFQDKYKGHQQRLFDEIQLFFAAMGDDPLNQRLGDDFKRLTKDLLFNAEGNLAFKPKLWNDIRHTILPTIIRQVGYVPIPRAEYEDDKIAVVIENLVLSGPNLFPNIVHIEAHNEFTFSPYDNINKTLDTHHHRFRLGLSQSQCDIRDVAFAFRRKSGWPLRSDHGLADVVIAGKGISVDIELESVENRRDQVFKVNHVNVQVDTLKFSIRDSKHDILYKFLKATASGIIKKAVTVAVQSAMRTALENLDDQLVQIRDTVEEARKSDETTRTQALKDLYARKKSVAEEKKEHAAERTGTFRIVANRDSQLNPDLTHDTQKSVAKRMWKTEDLAHSGKEWHSQAFDLFDPKHPAVTGEHHPHAQKGAGTGQSLTSKVQDPNAPATSTGGNQGPSTTATAQTK